jgi:hypothetical protein
MLASAGDVDIRVLMVWIPMLSNDTDAAARAAATLYDDPRIAHFYDAGQHAGRAIADLLGGEGATAWDVYLMYGRHTTWERKPPHPYSWAHQLRHDAWAVPARYHAGGALVSELRRTVGELRRSR